MALRSVTSAKIKQPVTASPVIAPLARITTAPSASTRPTPSGEEQTACFIPVGNVNGKNSML